LPLQLPCLRYTGMRILCHSTQLRSVRCYIRSTLQIITGDPVSGLSCQLFYFFNTTIGYSQLQLIGCSVEKVVECRGKISYSMITENTWCFLVSNPSRAQKSLNVENHSSIYRINLFIIYTVPNTFSISEELQA
jgi:hypothetical protein